MDKEIIKRIMQKHFNRGNRTKEVEYYQNSLFGFKVPIYKIKKLKKSQLQT
jgi:hypothetical protein